ncbi:hypothetical protein F383_22331 [Gossypium arboreum]|uniref:Uncharacterized protein n=1 Tax=Gossypium arboreum TaxID=29729 RepID=A0A0B0P226_GOSAR|nr:hypothetical protein F383_22331 [Gossypium arboreum]
MGQHTKSTRLGLPHTGRSHAPAHLAALTTAFSNRTRTCPYRAQGLSNSKKANFKGS